MAETGKKILRGSHHQMALLLLALSAGACPVAQASGYIGLDGSSLDIQNTLDDELNPGGVRLRLGMPVAHLVDVELHLGGGSESQTTAADRLTAVYMGAFLKGYLPVGRRSAFYGLAGFSAVEYTQTLDAREFFDERSGFSYGFGLETEISSRMDLSADYVRYVNDDGPFSELSSVNLGVKLYF